MVKALVTLADGRVLIVMGVSEDNVRRLKGGEPIYFEAAALKIAPGTEVAAMALFYGETDHDLAHVLHTLIGPQTVVIVAPRGDERPQ